MSIKVHLLHSHPDKVLANCDDASEEQGERFYQDIKTMEECNQRRWDKQMMVEY